MRVVINLNLPRNVNVLQKANWRPLENISTRSEWQL